MRLPVLNTFSAICLFFVILNHSSRMYSFLLTNSGFSNWQVLDVEVVTFIIHQGGRFAIPFFFLTVGFYYGKALQRGAHPFTFLILYGRKLLYVFFSWSLIYAFIKPTFMYKFKYFGILNSIYEQLKITCYWAINNKLDFIRTGTEPHLWFIVACLMGLAITSFFCKYRIDRFLIPFGVGLYLIGLLGGSYSKLPIGLSFPFKTPNPLFSTIFIAVGRWFSIHHEKNKRLALSLFFSGALMHFAEIFYLKRMYNVYPNQDFLLGTMIWGIGAFLLCLEYPNAGQNSILERMGMLTLGIYVSHPLIIYALLPVFVYVTSIFWEILISVFVLLLCYGFCQGLIRNRISAKFLT